MVSLQHGGPRRYWLYKQLLWVHHVLKEGHITKDVKPKTSWNVWIISKSTQGKPPLDARGPKCFAKDAEVGALVREAFA
ncbi:hypothetical protein VNO77_27292 [Canavalia gladiata]|uniref:Uncharacterized protein n=1 Tax=Canavalia gladiata TaxID=3824 RepID=A0AAN9KXL2_CANGL